MAENISVTLVLDDSQYTGKIDRAGKSVEDFGNKSRAASDKSRQGFENLNHSAEMLKAKMELLQTAILGAGFVEFARRTLETADRVSDLSAATNVTVPELLNLREAFEASGGTADRLGRSLSSLSQNINAAREGSAVAQESLAKLGLTFSDMANLSTYDAMKKAAATLAAMSDPVERNALAFRVFGKEARGIDWAKLSAEVARGGGEYSAYAEALDKAGEAHDKLAAAAGKLEIAFINLLERTGILDAINGMSSDMGRFEKAVTVAGIAFGIYFGAKTIEGVVGLATGITKVTTALEGLLVATKVLEKGTVFGRIASLALLLASAGAAYFGFEKLQDEMAARDKKRDEEAAARKKAAEDDPAKNKPATKPEVERAWAKEIAAIDAISESYKRSNDEALTKIDLQTKLIGQSEDQRQLQEALTNATIEYDKQQASLSERIRQVTADSQIGAEQKKDTIAALNREKQQVKEVYDAYTTRVTQAIKLQQELNAAQRFRNSMYEDQIGLENRLSKIQDESNKAGLSDRQRRYYDIAAAARESAKAEADAEEKRLGFDADGKKIKLTAEARQKFLDAAQERAQIEIEAAQRADEQATQFSTGWSRAYRQFAEDSANAASFAQQQFSTMTKGLEDAFINFAKTGRLSFKSLINDMIEQMLRNDFRKLMGSLLGTGGAGGGGGGGGGLFSSIASLFGFANGGPVSLNKPILVGERGPEIFIPTSNGSIVPNSNLGSGGSQQVNYYINAVDAPSFQALVARDPAFIHAVAMAGARAYPSTRR